MHAKTLSIAVSIDDHNKDRSHNLAKQLSLPTCTRPGNNQIAQKCASFDYVLCYENGNRDELPILTLTNTSGIFGGPVFVDFIGGKAGHRRHFGGGRGQPLARAIGLKGGINPTIIDVTAGLGKDAFVLACLGAQIDLIERSPMLAALLKDGMDRALHDPEITDIVTNRMNLIQADSIEWLSRLPPEQRPDVVYMDPMYPHRNKSALVKKEMRYLREIVGEDEDASQLLHAALSCAKRRVVVKRPRAAPILDGPLLNHRKPDTAIESKNTRYDIYFTRS
jgi:16S rRNA (guanine1516-N2)-methyltransferase